MYTILEHQILLLVCCLFQRQDEEEAMLIEMEKDSAVTATNIDDDIMVIMLQCSPFITFCLPAKSDSDDIMFCLHSYQGLRIERSLVY